MFRKILIFVLVILIGGVAYWLISPFLSNTVVYENENSQVEPMTKTVVTHEDEIPVVEIEPEAKTEPTPTVAPAKPIPVSAPKPTQIIPSNSEDISSIEDYLNSLDFSDLDSGL